MIRQLESSMINKIAAGEVVERPLSVVKELAENSIDAGAAQIEIEIKDGGTSYIRVSDNGSGIPKAEVRTAFARHATSKISTMDDLESVMTMGFRGEALSSIAAVAQVELVTKTAEQDTGARLEISGGEILSESDVGAADGTGITVKNLFANVPARRKFLKKPATEGGYISDIINKLALGNPGVAFKYINNGSAILQTRGDGELKNVIFSIYGKEVAGALIELKYNRLGVKLGGYIGKPSVSRGNRNYSLLYINGRYVKSGIVQSAVEEAYKTKLTQGKFPFCVLHMSVSPETVDVNVHPTKLEVRFSDDELIYKSVLAAVSAALKSESLIPLADIPQKGRGGEYSPGNNKSPAPGKSLYDTLYDTRRPPVYSGGAVTVSENTDGGGAEEEAAPRKSGAAYAAPVENIPPMKPAAAQKEAAPAFSPPQAAPAPREQAELSENGRQGFFSNYRIVGQLFNTYWLIEQGASVYLIDQHAAHERVLYENLIKTLKSGKADSQKLVQPLIIPVSQGERQLIRDNAGFFENCGFELDEFDQSSYVLYAVPFVFGSPVGAGFFIEILDSLGTFEKKIENVYDAKLDAIATISCKAAVKANDRLSSAEARGLVERILALDDPFTCPHGRPTVVELSKTALEKLFKRVQP